MRASSWHINYSTFIYPFKPGKGKNYKNLNISRRKSFLDETKNIFQSFEGLSFGEKVKKPRTKALLANKFLFKHANTTSK